MATNGAVPRIGREYARMFERAVGAALTTAFDFWSHQRVKGFTSLVGDLGEYLAVCAEQAVEIDDSAYFKSDGNEPNTARDTMALIITGQTNRSRLMITRVLSAVVSIALAALALGGCSLMDQDPPPATEFDEAEAYLVLEQAAAEIVAGLPDFPGFNTRWYMRPQDCGEALGSRYEGWVAIEIGYGFSGADSALPLVRTEYADLLRESWQEAGYDVHRDDIDETTGVGSIEAERPDGVNLWWTAAKGVSLTLQTGCVPQTPDFDKPDYLPPAGGSVTIDDALAGALMHPPTADTTEAVDPFATEPASPTTE